MKKDGFINGAIIVSTLIIITKLLGVLYVIPFYSLVGDEGGALYGYAYTIYAFFISLSTAGIPLAISRVVSEYYALGFYNTKQKAFVLFRRLALLFGFIFFLIMFFLAPFLAHFIIGEVVGGNSIEDVTFVIRVISIAILFVPILSIYRGYFEGHRFMKAPSISQVIEQVVRIIIIIFGCLIGVKLFRFNLKQTVAIALVGASVGALVSLIFLSYKYINNKKKFNDKIRKVNEPIISNKNIVKKVLFYALPFIMIDIYKSLYNYVDMFSVVKALVKYANYTALDAESIYSMLSTWCVKFNMIILSISSGFVVSLVPNLTESFVKNNKKDINSKVVLSFSLLLFIIIPITFGISFLSKPIWYLFYGKSLFGPDILSVYIFVGLFASIFTFLITILQVFKDYKILIVCLLSGILTKIILNINLLRTFYSIGFSPYYGVVFATILGYLVSIVICLIVLFKKYNINFEVLFKRFIDIICASLIMIIVLYFFKLFVPIVSSNRILNLLIICFYGLLGCIIYLCYSYFTGLLDSVLGKNRLKEIIKRLKIK